MFPTVLNANQFNSYIQNKKFDKALDFIQKNDVCFSYIDSNSVSCFEALTKATYQHFTIHGSKLSSQDILLLEKIIIPLLDKEPHYWYKQSFNMQNNVYYFFTFFLQSNNLEKINFFHENVKKFTNIEIEKFYIYARNMTSEMGELIRNSTENTKISIDEISMAYADSHYRKSTGQSNDSFIPYLDSLIATKKDRKLTYKHDEFLDFCLRLTNDNNFINIFSKLVELYSPELFKHHKAKPSIEEAFPHLSSRLDFLAARLFSCMNFNRTVNGTKEKSVDKSLTLPLLSFLQKINPKENINDYLIGEFRYMFVPIALEFLIPSDSKDWPSDLNLSKEEGFHIASKYFSNFFVHLLADSLVVSSTFSTEEVKLNRLKEYKDLYPQEFKKDLIQFEKGLECLGLKQALNADINNIRLYFKMTFNQEENTTVTTKVKKNKI